MKTIHFSIFCSAITLAAFISVSCAKMDFPKGSGEINNQMLKISGAAISSGEGNKPIFIPGIRIVASTFEDDNSVTPLEKDTVYTSELGTYSLEIDRKGCHNFRLEAFDIDGQNNLGVFGPGLIEMNVEQSCPEMKEQNFYLSRL